MAKKEEAKPAAQPKPKSTFWQDWFGYIGDPVTEEWDRESDEVWDAIERRKEEKKLQG